MDALPLHLAAISSHSSNSSRSSNCISNCSSSSNSRRRSSINSSKPTIPRRHLQTTDRIAHITTFVLVVTTTVAKPLHPDVTYKPQTGHSGRGAQSEETKDERAQSHHEADDPHNGHEDGGRPPRVVHQRQDHDQNADNLK